jgi:hypothetical protein
VLRITPRAEPLVPDAVAFRAFVAAGFSRPAPLRRNLAGRVPPSALKRALRALGRPPNATAPDLDLHAWAALFDAVRAGR